MQSTPDNLPRQVMATSQLLARRRTNLTFAPDAAARAAIAAALDLIDLKDCRFAGEARPEGRGDLVIEGRLTARATQACVVTLAPVPAKVDEPVLRRYLADWTAPEGDETEIPDDDTIEPLSAQIDIAALVIEALALALPDYPRAPGASFEPAPDDTPAEATETPKPLAGLAALMAEKARKP